LIRGASDEAHEGAEDSIPSLGEKREESRLAGGAGSLLANGRRSLREISHLVAAEIARQNPEFLKFYFETLEEAGIVTSTACDPGRTGNGQPTLTTGRLALRPFGAGDAMAVQAPGRRFRGRRHHACDPSSLPGRWPRSGYQSHRARFEAGESAIFAVVLRETGELVVRSASHHQAARSGGDRLLDRQALLGPRLLHRGGQGSDGIRFTNYRLNRVYATHFVRNPLPAG